jgi:hypothetical protein
MQISGAFRALLRINLPGQWPAATVEICERHPVRFAAIARPVRFLPEISKLPSRPGTASVKFAESDGKNYRSARICEPADTRHISLHDTSPRREIADAIRRLS